MTNYGRVTSFFLSFITGFLNIARLLPLVWVSVFILCVLCVFAAVDLSLRIVGSTDLVFLPGTLSRGERWGRDMQWQRIDSAHPVCVMIPEASERETLHTAHLDRIITLFQY